MRHLLRNGFGSFADCAVLFPIVILLGQRGIFAPALLLGSAGLLYVSAGVFFRIPMPVQPLKSIAIGALAMGATSLEIRWAAGLLGVFCLSLIVLRADSLFSLVPMRLVHQVQVGLGALLFTQALQSMQGSSWSIVIFALALIFLMLFLPSWQGVPAIGIVATGSMVFALWAGFNSAVIVAEPHLAQDGLSVQNIAALLLPQLALTMANSVVGTRSAALAYFGEIKAARVTYRSLCGFIGLGNIAMALVAGLPFCHGSGGLTAHVKGGADSSAANNVIGSFLLILAIMAWWGGSVALAMPAAVMGALLFVVGVHHLGLARTTAQSPFGLASLVAAFLIALLSRNLLLVLLMGFVFELVGKFAPARFLQSMERS